MADTEIRILTLSCRQCPDRKVLRTTHTKAPAVVREWFMVHDISASASLKEPRGA